jgi:ppGpp synthetase/RelA/SpoT-type nucleotidyltranferase
MINALLSATPPADWELEILAVSECRSFDFTMKQIKRAGKVIAGRLLWSPETEQEIREAFRVANNWRDTHAYPLLSVRHQLIYYMGFESIDGLTAARLKRMQAIRRKLRRPDMSIGLDQLQDLGGCRAILSSIGDVQKLVACLKSRSKHDLWNEDDYIAIPKSDGYRSYHLMYKFRAREGGEIYNGRRIEIQIRTRLQHAWATAVEGIGLFRGEDLKGNQGNREWLRLFELVSSEFAFAENCAEVATAPPRRERVQEIIALERSLRADKTLENISNAVRWTESAIQVNGAPSYYLIKYDNKTKQVNVAPYFRQDLALASYDKAEFADNAYDTEKENIVLVEADKIDSLRDAYPNYFGDMQLFRMQLRRVTTRLPIREYTVKPQEQVPAVPKQVPDTSWFRRPRFRKPRLKFPKSRAGLRRKPQ